MFMDFITLCVDQLVNMAAKLAPIYGQRCPLVVRTPPGGGRGYGATHSQSLERLFTGVPGIEIVAPATAEDAAALLQTALRREGPVLFLEHKLLYPMRFDFPDGLPEPAPFGRARVVRAGADVTLIAWSYMSVLCVQAAQVLADEGISAEVIDLRTLAPLDAETLAESARRTGRVVVVEEGPRTGGFAAEIACRIGEAAGEYLEKPVRRVCGRDAPLPSARAAEAACLPDVAAIVAAARELME